MHPTDHTSLSDQKDQILQESVFSYRRVYFFPSPVGRSSCPFQWLTSPAVPFAATYVHDRTRVRGRRQVAHAHIKHDSRTSSLHTYGKRIPLSTPSPPRLLVCLPRSAAYPVAVSHKDVLVKPRGFASAVRGPADRCLTGSGVTPPRSDYTRSQERSLNLIRSRPRNRICCRS